MRIKIIIFFTILNFNIVNAETLSVDSNKIFKNLRCLICQGQSVYDSDSEFANSLKIVVDKKIIKKIIGPLNNDLSLQIQELIK